MNDSRQSDDILNDLGWDLEFTSCTPRKWGGMWVRGSIAGHRFEALAFQEHAANPDHEFRDSRLSKLWVQRMADGKTAFNWDRGLDIEPADAVARAIVDFLAQGLAEYAFDHPPFDQP
jgi:hypothetical protein